jgi:bacillithiol system protein YtxJ
MCGKEAINSKRERTKYIKLNHSLLIYYMNWQSLTEEAQLAKITAASFVKPQLVFKHSTTCGISLHAQARLEAAIESLSENFDLHYLDLLSYRSVSNQIATDWNVVHQSPQVILLKDGNVLFNTSHQGIQPHLLLAKV